MWRNKNVSCAVSWMVFYPGDHFVLRVKPKVNVDLFLLTESNQIVSFSKPNQVLMLTYGTDAMYLT